MKVNEIELNKCHELYVCGVINRDEMIERCKPPILGAITKAFNRVTDDWIQEGYIVALECLDEYDLLKHKHSFLTHLYNRIIWRLKRYVWEDAMIRKPVYLYEKNIDREKIDVLSCYGGRVRNFDANNFAKEFSVESFEESFINKTTIEEAVAKLTKNQKLAILLDSIGYKEREIGCKIGVSRQRVHQLKNQAIENFNCTESNTIGRKKPNMDKSKCFNTNFKPHVLDAIINRKGSMKKLSDELKIPVQTLYWLQKKMVSE